MFDTCGFLQNVVINLKILLYEICEQKVDWDEIIGDDLRKKWEEMVDGLKAYPDVQIERYFFAGLSDPVDRVYLHGFSDASQVALRQLFILSL